MHMVRSVIRSIIRPVLRSVIYITLAKLLQLPYADATGKLIFGKFFDSREDDIWLIDAWGKLFQVPGALSALVPGGIPALEYARWVQNLLSSSVAAPQNTGVGGDTITPLGDGAFRLKREPVGSGDFRWGDLVSGTAGNIYCGQIQVRRVTGTGTIHLDVNDDGAIFIESELAGEYKIFSTAGTQATAYRFMDVALGTVGDEVEIHVPQIENTTGQTDPTIPGEHQIRDPANSLYGLGCYTTELANTVSSGVVTEAVGATLSPYPQFVHWYQSTNSLIYSRDFSSWSASGGAPTLAQDQVGIDGLPDTATTLGDDSAVVALGKFIDTTVPNDSNTETYHFYIGKDNDETRFPEVQLTLQNGTLQQIKTQVNTKTGAKTDRTATGTVSSSVESFNASFWKLILKVANNSTGNTTCKVQVFPAITTTWGTVESSATGTIIIDWAHLGLNRDFASPPIRTTGAAVSRDSTQLKHPRAGYFYQGAGTAVMWVRPRLAAAVLSVKAGLLSVRDGSSTSVLYLGTTEAGRLASFDGTNTAHRDLTAWSADDLMLFFSSWETGGDIDAGGKVGGGALETDATPPAYDGDWQISGDNIEFFKDCPQPMVFEGLGIYNQKLTNTQVDELP